jgi:hypothetical protein
VEWSEAAMAEAAPATGEAAWRATDAQRELLRHAMGEPAGTSGIAGTDPSAGDSIPIWLVPTGSHLAGWEALDGLSFDLLSPDSFATNASAAFLVQRAPHPSGEPPSGQPSHPMEEREQPAYSVLDEVPLDLHTAMLLVRGMPLDRDELALVARTSNGESVHLPPTAIQPSSFGSDEELFLLWAGLPEGIREFALDFAAPAPGQRPSSVHFFAAW